MLKGFCCRGSVLTKAPAVPTPSKLWGNHGGLPLQIIPLFILDPFILLSLHPFIQGSPTKVKAAQ
jgi:hypothetical protein